MVITYAGRLVLCLSLFLFAACGKEKPGLPSGGSVGRPGPVATPPAKPPTTPAKKIQVVKATLRSSSKERIPELRIGGRLGGSPCLRGNPELVVLQLTADLPEGTTLPSGEWRVTAPKLLSSPYDIVISSDGKSLLVSASFATADGGDEAVTTLHADALRSGLDLSHSGGQLRIELR